MYPTYTVFLLSLFCNNFLHKKFWEPGETGFSSSVRRYNFKQHFVKSSSIIPRLTSKNSLLTLTENIKEIYNNHDLMEGSVYCLGRRQNVIMYREYWVQFPKLEFHTFTAVREKAFSIIPEDKMLISKIYNNHRWIYET